MVFGGIQKLTLLDFPEKTACTVFTVGCDFNCPFCQNSALIGQVGLAQTDINQPQGEQPNSHGARAQTRNKNHTAADILDFLKTRQGLLDGVCISGGEPLLNDELEAFIDEVKALGFLVKLDTNGSNPAKLEKLIKAGKIDYVAMDIKNTPEKYAQTIGVPAYDISPVEKSMNLLRSGAVPYEFRTTVVREFHSGEDIISIANWISGTVKYYLQGFVNSDGVSQKGLHGYSREEMEQFLDSITPILPTAELRGI